MENIRTKLFFKSPTGIPAAPLSLNKMMVSSCINEKSGGFMGLKREIHSPIAEAKDVSHNAKCVELVAVESDQMKSSVGTGEKKGQKKVRKHRIAFQTRSQVDILDDGYRWRKYGQKAVQNNKFPRSYYRCTHQGCSVKKQVQRLSRDESIVVTTYEGIHTHPVEKHSDNFEQILNQTHIYPPF